MQNYNYITNKAYCGSNADTLEDAKILLDVKSDAWLTFLQARKAGRQIIKGSKGVKLIKVVDQLLEKKSDDKDRPKHVGCAVKHFVVFNLDQTKVIT